jgi:hypothetical protein
MPDPGMERFAWFAPSIHGGFMTLPDPHLPLNPGHVLDDPPEDEASTADEATQSPEADTGPGTEPVG